MTQEIEVHDAPPEHFSPQVEVAACYLECGGKLLVMERAHGKLEGAKWGVPAGKLEKGETPEEGARRELFEETGITVSSLQLLGALYIRKPGVDYIYHMFKVHLDGVPEVRLSDEHLRYLWATEIDLQQLPLMAGAKRALERYRLAIKPKRAGASVNAYLILKQGDKILFHLRKNTGYCDGMWSLVAGHVEDGEPATAGMVREAREEIGIEIDPSDLTVVHIMHRKSNRLNVDVFFECRKWKGEIQNCEPHKCEHLEFFSMGALPANTVDYNVSALKSISKNEFYSEVAWNISGKQS